MAVELKHGEFNRVEAFFNKNQYQIPAMAVLKRNFPGKVFVDNRDKPEIVLVWALSRWSYISCRELLPKHKDFIFSVFNSKIVPIIKASGDKRFEVYADNNKKWDTILKRALSEYELNKHYENTFVLNRDKFEILKSCLEVPENIEICENVYPLIPKEYQSYAAGDEYQKSVFGMSIRKNDKIISQCLNNGFVYENNYFIDLDTLDAGERNKGYGTLISCKLVNNQLKKGLLPLWETTLSNLPSQRVANKLGFEKVDEYPVYSIKGY